MRSQLAPPSLDPAEVAVIVPVLDEASRLPALLADLATLGVGAVVIADGGSTDGSAALARAQGAQVVEAPRGRARQQNAGAAAAPDAGVLVFLHADTRLPPDALARMAAVLARADAGCFRLRFDRRSALLSLYGRCSRLESYWTSFGDQAFFMRRRAFEAVGGFPDLPLLEDVALRRRLKRGGWGFAKAAASALTSARRFEAEGLVRRQLKNGLILGLHALGMHPRHLLRFYR